MDQTSKPSLVVEGLDNLLAEYSKEYREPGIHVSDLIYCLTKSYFDKTGPLPATPDELLLFALGLGLQKVLIPREADMAPIIMDNVICSPDYKSKDGAAELKTTRVREGKELPDTWIQQIKAYCYVTNQTSYDLLVLHMGAYKPALVGWELRFTWEEIAEHWMYLMGRKEILVGALANKEIPEPYKYCEKWQCRNCRYSLRCEMVSKYLKEDRS